MTDKKPIERHKYIPTQFDENSPCAWDDHPDGVGDPRYYCGQSPDAEVHHVAQPLECPSCSVHPHRDPCTPRCGQARAEKPHEFKFATHCPKCSQPQPEAARVIEHCGWCETDYDFHTQTIHCPHDFKVTAVKAPVAPEGETPPTWDLILSIARGCVDYGGGYRSDNEKLAIFHHGIQTVVNVLEAASKNGLRDTQVAALYATGKRIQP